MKAITRRPAADAPPPARRPVRWGGRLLSVAAFVLAASILVPSAQAATGDLRYDGCIGDLAGCTPTSPAGALDGAAAVAVTPGGTDLYAASHTGDDVSHFRIDTAGNLIFAGCIGNLAGCTPITPHVLDNALGLAVTRDSAHLYAAAFLGNAVSHFTIAPLSAARH